VTRVAKRQADFLIRVAAGRQSDFRASGSENLQPDHFLTARCKMFA